MATPSAQMNLSGLARKLVLDGLLQESDAIKAQDAANKKKIPFVTYLVEQKLIDSNVAGLPGSRVGHLRNARTIW